MNRFSLWVLIASVAVGLVAGLVYGDSYVRWISGGALAALGVAFIRVASASPEMLRSESITQRVELSSSQELEHRLYHAYAELVRLCGGLTSDTPYDDYRQSDRWVVGDAITILERLGFIDHKVALRGLDDLAHAPDPANVELIQFILPYVRLALHRVRTMRFEEEIDRLTRSYPVSSHPEVGLPQPFET